LLVALAMRRSIEGPIPTCASCAVSRKNFVNRSIAFWAMTVAALLLALVLGNPALLLLWLALTAGALIFTFSGDRSRVTGELEKDRTMVQLKGVAGSFVNALAGGPPTPGRPGSTAPTILPGG
jgi:hypothetical protein